MKVYRVNGGQWFDTLAEAESNADMPVIAIEVGQTEDNCDPVRIEKITLR